MSTRFPFREFLLSSLYMLEIALVFEANSDALFWFNLLIVWLLSLSQVPSLPEQGGKDGVRIKFGLIKSLSSLSFLVKEAFSPIKFFTNISWSKFKEGQRSKWHLDILLFLLSMISKNLLSSKRSNASTFSSLLEED